MLPLWRVPVRGQVCSANASARARQKLVPVLRSLIIQGRLPSEYDSTSGFNSSTYPFHDILIMSAPLKRWTALWYPSYPHKFKVGYVHDKIKLQVTLHRLLKFHLRLLNIKKGQEAILSPSEQNVLERWIVCDDSQIAITKYGNFLYFSSIYSVWWSELLLSTADKMTAKSSAKKKYSNLHGALVWITEVVELLDVLRLVISFLALPFGMIIKL